MSDILYDAAIEFKRLEKTVYKIILGRKGYAYTIMLHFPSESFFHLAGLQHLTDITFPSKNKERIYKEILKKNITIDDLKKSEFYQKWFIEERLLCFRFLKEIIESNSIMYLINSQRYIRYTQIRANYLCEYKNEYGIIYLFLVIEIHYPKFENECKGCSIFKKHDYDFTNGTSKTTTLLIEKTVNEITEIIFKNPSYKEDAAN